MRNRLLRTAAERPLTLNLQVLTVVMATLVIIGLLGWMMQLQLFD
jgi:hypothetical protein